ncbi:glycosyltransferase [Robertkochia solimangrovi]|uniref:glycosyltransferase n=1 Tax=Robertkochia solimangrovi TaxID=2213046 RepID=UPI00117D6087|nr:glycosyltransferase [Robertkochia solimangrovi]TRZ46019.1 glycosyltransferase family 4 protein [Robertkochia solimangrovi]
MKVAIIHYWFVTRRGGEKVVEKILEIFPDADIYTLFYDRKTYGDFLDDNKVYVSNLGKIGFFRKHYQKIFPLYPLGIKSLKLKDNYDLIISSESGPAKGISKPEGTPHICYIHSPMRYCWGYTSEYVKSLPAILRLLAKFFFERLRIWDESTIDNVDLYIANSENVQDRVKRFYKKEACVIHPPIHLKLFENEVKSNFGEYFLSFGAITPYKRIDLLVDAFNENGKKLVIIGDGSEKQKLEYKSKSNIEFTGTLDWSDIEKHIYRAKALIFPGEEDFGMIPLEVMAYGLPVLAFGQGGALETVIENLQNVGESSGLFFYEQTVNSINSTIDLFEKISDQIDPDWIRRHSRKFGEDVFDRKMRNEINAFISREFNADY